MSAPKAKSGTEMSPDNISRFIEALEQPKKTLTRWEEDFLVSIRDQFDRTGELSERQFEILEKLYTEKAP